MKWKKKVFRQILMDSKSCINLATSACNESKFNQPTDLVLYALTPMVNLIIIFENLQGLETVSFFFLFFLTNTFILHNSPGQLHNLTDQIKVYKTWSE